MKERWFVTWRHNNKSPMEAQTYMVSSKAEGEIKQEELLNLHKSDTCYSCSLMANKYYVQGDNDNIVTKIRTEEDVYQTIYKSMGLIS